MVFAGVKCLELTSKIITTGPKPNRFAKANEVVYPIIYLLVFLFPGVASCFLVIVSCKMTLLRVFSSK
jgi:hypothetical protein